MDIIDEITIKDRIKKAAHKYIVPVVRKYEDSRASKFMDDMEEGRKKYREKQAEKSRLSDELIKHKWREEDFKKNPHRYLTKDEIANARRLHIGRLTPEEKRKFLADENNKSQKKTNEWHDSIKKATAKNDARLKRLNSPTRNKIKKVAFKIKRGVKKLIESYLEFIQE